jgi:CBS-domain-containing membrane protein
MSEPVIVITPDTPLEKAVDLMLKHKIKKLPVMEKLGNAYQLSGILSLIDVARVQPDLINRLKEMVQVETESMAPAFYVC